MNRVGLIVAFVLALSCALAVPAAGQSPPQSGAPEPAGASSAGLSLPFAPSVLSRLSAGGGAVVSGHIWGFSGATVVCSAPGGSVTTTTGPDGAYSCSGLPAAGGNGTIWVRTGAADGLVLGRTALTWADPGPTTFDLSAGAIKCIVTRGGPLPSPTSISVNLSGADGVSQTVSWSTSTEVAGPDPLTVDARGSQGPQSKVAVYWWSNEGVEADIGVTIGGMAPVIGPYDEADACRTRITSPYWASGAPGTRVRLLLAGYRAGWVNRLNGQPGYPFGAPVDALGTTTASGNAAGDAAYVTVPAATKPGYAYKITAQHSTGPLGLTTWFQVCTLKPSASTISRGKSIRLKGIVPISGHEGATAGRPTKVTVYARTSAGAQPSRWDPSGQGWRKVATDTTDGFGAYSTIALRPTRTTWYVARYPGDSRYRGAYTSVVKVKVR
jgi:hypothetical protein